MATYLKSLFNMNRVEEPYKIYSLQSNRKSPPQWKEFRSDRSYIGVLDTQENCCYVEQPALFKSKKKGWTLHSSMMEGLGRWEDYQKWLKDPVGYKSALLTYCGFAHEENTGWVGQSCTLNVAHSVSNHSELKKVCKVAGRSGRDKSAKKQGLHIMTDSLWKPLKKQLDSMTNKVFEEKLPPGWEIKLDKNSGRYFYVDHNTQKTSWTKP